MSDEDWETLVSLLIQTTGAHHDDERKETHLAKGGSIIDPTVHRNVDSSDFQGKS
jgi:hypothetical protein